MHPRLTHRFELITLPEGYSGYVFRSISRTEIVPVVSLSKKERTALKTLFNSADLYLKESDWKDLALVKFCLFSMGVLVSGFLPQEKKRCAQWAAFVVFVGTYIPLMHKYFRVLKNTSKGAQG